MSFEQDLVDSVQKSIIKDIKEMKFLDHWSKLKLNIPDDIVQKAYASINRERIFALVKSRIEEQIAKTIVGNLLTETASDTKKIMCDPELRQSIKNKVYPKILQMIDTKED